VDHHDHEALGALDHARGGGLGTELLTRLSDRACQEGIRRFTAAVAADNAAMAGLLRNFGGEQVRREFGTHEYEIDLRCRVTRP
jgi:RimJ/RimL family protein N-acetyltransferase